jgi:G3E family GTPase
VRGDLAKVLKGSLYERISSFDGVIIQTTGLADPAPVAHTFFVDEEVSQIYKLDGIITVVDAKHCLEHLNEEKPEGVENESVEQVAFADRIILNKTDLVSETELEEVVTMVKSINSTANILRTQNSVVSPKELLNISSFSLERVTEMDPEFLNTDGEHMHDQRVSTCSATFDGDINAGLLDNWISHLMRKKGTDLFRYKGILAVKGMKEKHVFQGVHMLFSQTALPGQFWEEGETRRNTFVFIGRDLDKDFLVKGFKECQVTAELRYKEGDEVQARCQGGWYRGTIGKCWDEGWPYRIDFDQWDPCWAPEDHDDYVCDLCRDTSCKEPACVKA